MARPTIRDIDALVGPATPHFAYQLRARVRELIEELPEDDEVRRYGEEKMELLDRLGHASSKAEDGTKEPRSRAGWETIPSAAPAYEPLPPRR
jgi:RecB family exonuclease